MQWFRDRVIFDNPGDSLVPIADSLRGGATVSRNPLIQQLIRMCDLAEQAGMGMVTLHERWTALTGHAPTVKTDPAHKTYAIEFPWEQAAHLAEITEQVNPHVNPHVTPQVTQHVTPQVESLLAVLTGEMHRSEMMAMLALKDRMHFATSYLTPAFDAGLIEMTIPDKPRSSRQKYRLTDVGRALFVARSGQRP